jgi:VanZ family protein
LKEFLRNNFRWLLWGLLIIVLFSIPGDQLPEVPSFLTLFEPDKLVHLILFAVYTWLMIAGLRKEGRMYIQPGTVIFFSILTGTILSGGTEILQYYCIPGRIASLPDFIANEVGCFAGWGIYKYLTRSKVQNGKMVK